MFGTPANSKALVYAPSRGASFYLTRLTALLLLSGIPILLTSIARDDYRPVELYFDYMATPFLVACALAEVVLAQRAVAIFVPGEPLRAAWRVIRAAAVFQAMGLILWHLLGTALIRNPLVHGGPLWNQQVIQQFRDAGYILSGPLRMAWLSVGLGIALRTMNRLIRPRVTPVDYALLVPAVAFAVYQTHLFSTRVMDANQPENFATLMDAANNPLLALLLFQALMIYRSLREMGGGLIARCWGAFAAGIVLTCLGTFGQWATNYGYLSWPYSALVWYLWLPAAAAYALAPAYQLEAAWALRVVELKTRTRETQQEEAELRENQPRALRVTAPIELEQRAVAAAPQAPAITTSASDGPIKTLDSVMARWEQTLTESPTLLGKLITVSECRQGKSACYHHETLQIVAPEIAIQVLSNSHGTLFTSWLTLSLEEKLKDWIEYHGSRSENSLGGPNQDWQRLIPASATKAERLLFETDLAVMLELTGD